jgi:hypothetical protein
VYGPKVLFLGRPDDHAAAQLELSNPSKRIPVGAAVADQSHREISEEVDIARRQKDHGDGFSANLFRLLAQCAEMLARAGSGTFKSRSGGHSDLWCGVPVSMIVVKSLSQTQENRISPAHCA